MAAMGPNTQASFTKWLRYECLTLPTPLEHLQATDSVARKHSKLHHNELLNTLDHLLSQLEDEKHEASEHAVLTPPTEASEDLGGYQRASFPLSLG